MSLSQIGDNINQLPFDKTPPEPKEIHIINTLFKENKQEMNSIFREVRDPLLIFILVVAVSLPQTDMLLDRFVPINSPYAKIILKGVIVGILFWLIKYFHLSRQD